MFAKAKSFDTYKRSLESLVVAWLVRDIVQLCELEFYTKLKGKKEAH